MQTLSAARTVARPGSATPIVARLLASATPNCNPLISTSTVAQPGSATPIVARLLIGETPDCNP